MVTQSERQAGHALRAKAWLAVFSTFVFFAIGTAPFVFYRQHPENLEPTLGTDAVFPLFMAQFLPPSVAGLAIAGIFSTRASGTGEHVILEHSPAPARGILHFPERRRAPRSVPIEGVDLRPCRMQAKLQQPPGEFAAVAATPAQRSRKRVPRRQDTLGSPIAG